MFAPSCADDLKLNIVISPPTDDCKNQAKINKTVKGSFGEEKLYGVLTMPLLSLCFSQAISPYFSQESFG